MKLNEQGERLLSEIMNAGVEKSAEKLAVMSNAQWQMQSISVKVGSMEQLRSLLQDDGMEHYGAAFSMPGGAALLIASLAGARVMTKAYLGERASRARQSLAELEVYAVGEIANILVNTLAAELADACRIDFLITGPKVFRGTKPRLSEEIRKHFPWTGKDISLSSYVHVTSSSLSVGCSMAMFLNEGLAGKVVETLNKGL